MLRIFAPSIFTIFALLTFIASAAAQFPIPGEVIDVIDGKTVLVAIPGGKVKVELQYIDVPEQGQELHDTVKEHLRTLVVGRSVEYRPKTLLPDRAIGRLTIRNVDVSQQMLRDGAAWHHPIEESGQEKSEYVIYASNEATAKLEKIGVWSVAGLRPAWELRAESMEKARREAEERDARTAANRHSRGTNPSLGNVGALANGYDPVTRTGYLGTSYLGVREVDRATEKEQRTAIDISYFYKQDIHNRRKGTFVISIVSLSKQWRFLTDNDLIILGDGNVVIGKPKRTASMEGNYFREKLAYQVSRSTMERIVNHDEIVMKLCGYVLQPSVGLKYILYNLLQVSK